MNISVTRYQLAFVLSVIVTALLWERVWVPAPRRESHIAGSIAPRERLARTG